MNATRDRCYKYFYRVCLEMQGDEGTQEPQIKRDTSDFVFEIGWQRLNMKQRKQMKTAMKCIHPVKDDCFMKKLYNFLCVSQLLINCN
jgi:hypothetical protein